MVLNSTKLILNDQGLTHAHLGPSDVPYSPNQFLALDFLAISHSKRTLVCEDFWLHRNKFLSRSDRVCTLFTHLHNTYLIARDHTQAPTLVCTQYQFGLSVVERIQGRKKIRRKPYGNVHKFQGRQRVPKKPTNIGRYSLKIVGYGRQVDRSKMTNKRRM